MQNSGYVESSEGVCAESQESERDECLTRTSPEAKHDRRVEMIELFFQRSPQWWYKPGGKMGFEYGRSSLPSSSGTNQEAGASTH